MTKLNAHIHTFNIGEASKAGLARVDEDRVRFHAERQENIFPYVVGKGIMRPGLEYLGATGHEKARLIPFNKSLDEQALLELGYNAAGSGVLRVWMDDELVMRDSVTSAIGDGDFSSSSSWTLVTLRAATATISNGELTLAAFYKGARAICKQQVSTTDAGNVHGLRIVVTRGPVILKIGSTDGDDDYFSQADLDAGEHSLAFTPNGSFWIRFESATPYEVKVDSVEIENGGVMEIETSSWGEDTLRDIRHDQSLDIVFLAFASGKQQQIQRRGSGSWSVVDYLPTGGPFTVARTADVRLTPSVTRGNGTLSASTEFFEQSHVGALFQLTHGNSNFTTGLAGHGEVTKPIRVVGLNSSNIRERDFDVVTTGTWIATLTIQRSFDSEDSGFKDHDNESDITTNTTTDVRDDDDNQIVWYRVRVSDYTSGGVNVRIDYPGYGFSGVCRVTAVNNGLSADIEILEDFADTESTDVWLEGEWSDRRGYPTAVTLFDGRLWWARQDRFWGSASDAYYDFDVGDAEPADSIQRDISTGGTLAKVHWLLPLQRLIIGTEGSEASARSSSFNEPLTPDNVTLKDASSRGSFSARPARIDTRGVFIQSSGEELYEILYNIDINDYATRSLMRFHENIGLSEDPDNYADGFAELAVQREPETYLWAVRNDGVVPVMAYEPQDEIYGWFRFITGLDATNNRRDRVFSIAVLPRPEEHQVYMMIERDADDGAGGTTTSYHIEKLRFHKDIHTVSTAHRADGSAYREYANGLYLADAFVERTAAGETGGETFTVSHLDGKQQIAIGYPEGGSQPRPLSIADGSGSSSTIEIDEAIQAGTTVVIGLPYDAYYTSAKLAYGARGGTALLQKKRVPQIGLLLTNTHPDAIEVGSDFEDTEAMNELPRVRDGVDVEDDDFWQEFDEQAFPFGGTWDTDSRVNIKIKAGHSATINGLVVGVDTHET